ncbi:hypothetical protein ACE6H2_006208 [Prunus campanulata]
MNNLNKSDLDLIQLLNQFDPDSKSFKFGTKSFHVTGNAVTEILGLPNKGESVTLGYDRYTAAFRTRHFGQKGKPSKSQVEAALQKTIALANQPKKEKGKAEQKEQKKRGKAKKEAEEEEGEDKEETEVVDYDKEVVSLILILLCMTFLFANSSTSLHWKIFEHCVNLDTLSRYSWARAVAAYMNESLIAKAKEKAKKGGEASIGAVSGCTTLILLLFCERTNIIQPILGKEEENPAILKWSLMELHTRFSQIKDLNDIEGIFKAPKKRKTTGEEADLVEKGDLKTYKKRKTTREEGEPLDKNCQIEDDEGKQGEAEPPTPLAIQDILVKSMTDQIKNRQRQDPSFVFPKRLQLWKDSEKKMIELWDIFIQAEQRSMELQEELEKQKDKLDNEECISAALTVESTFQRQEILNLKRRIAELEGQKPHIDHEPEKAEEKEEEEKEEEEKEEEKEEEDKEEEKKKNAQSPDVPSRIQRLKNRERKRLQASCYEYEKDKQPKKKDAKKGDEEIPQFKLISSEEPSTQEDPLNQMESTQEASQPDATKPLLDFPKGTNPDDSIPVGLENSDDEALAKKTRKKPTKKKLGWGQKKVIEAYIQMEEEKIGPMQTDSPQYMSTWTWSYMQTFVEPGWHRALFEPLLEKLGKCNVLFFPIISSTEFHFTLLAFNKHERKWRHYNPLRSLGSRKEERCVDIAHNMVNIVEGWLEYIRPQAQVFLESRKIPKLVKQREAPPTPVLEDMSPNEELTLNWIRQNPYQFPFEEDIECAQQSSSS